MAPSAGLVSLLAGSVTPSFLLEAAGEYLKSLDTEINECELGINQGFNDDETKINEEREREGNFSSGGHDDRDETIKELEERARRQTGRKGNGGYRPKKGNGDELAWLRKDRDVIVQDVSFPSQPLTSPHPPTPLLLTQTSRSDGSKPSIQARRPPPPFPHLKKPLPLPLPSPLQSTTPPLCHPTSPQLISHPHPSPPVPRPSLNPTTATAISAAVVLP